MTTYEEEIYKFSTKDGNFETICDIIDQFQIIKHQLREDFWKEVITQLDLFLEEYPHWKRWKFSELNSKSAITIYREEFCKERENAAKISIRIEKLSDVPWYGLMIDRDQTWDDTEIKDLWEKAKELKSGNFKIGNINGWWWPLFNVLPYNFDSTKDLKQITPEKRHFIVADTLEHLKNGMKELIPFAEKYFLEGS